MFAAVQSRAGTPQSDELTELLAAFRSLAATPPPVLSQERADALRAALHDVVLRFAPAPADSAALDACLQLVAAPGPPPGADAPGVPVSPAPEKPVGGAPPSAAGGAATGSSRSATLDNCTRILDSLRYSAGGPIDPERLRALRDLAKDVSDSHQALRTFWISAAQLVLVNVLLPLLTALLGYIFGRSAGSSGTS